MTEIYPSDASLNALSGTTDPEHEVLYLPIGQSPYYTSFYKMQHRLLNVARRAGDLRVYKDGPLTFGVRAGRFMDGPTAVTYAGSTANALVDDTTNYIYLTVAGVLTVNQTAFPDPADTPHVPLATIITADGEYAIEDVADMRGLAMYRPAGPSAGGPPAAGSLEWAQLSSALKGIISPPAMILKLSATAAGWLALTVENGVWDESELTLTCTGAFTDYTYAEGDIIFIAGGAGVIPGGYVVASRDSANQLTLASSITGGADSADVSATGVGQPAIAYHFNAWLESVDGDVVPKQVPLLVTTLTDSVLTMDGASERIVLFGSDSGANTYLAFGESPAGEAPWHLMLLLTQDTGSDARFIVNTFLGDSIDVTIPYGP